MCLGRAGEAFGVGQKKVAFLEVEGTSWRSPGFVQLDLCVLPQGWNVGLAGKCAGHLYGEYLIQVASKQYQLQSVGS